MTFEDWTPLGRDTLIPAGVYDMKIADEVGHYLTELRLTVDAPRMATTLDFDLRPAFSGKNVFVTSAKLVPFDVPAITISVDEYDFLIGMATIGTQQSRSRATRQRNSQLLFKIIANARRSN